MTTLQAQVAYGICAKAETLFTAHGGFALEPSDLQRALLRVADGAPLGELASLPVVEKAFGGAAAIKLLPIAKPRELGILCGIRVGKSLIAACIAIHMAITCDVSGLRPGEVPRVSVVSTSKDNADVIFGHVVGHLEASPWLSVLIVKRTRGTKRSEQGKDTTDTVTLRHPTGRNVEIRVVAGSRAGSSLTSRWSAGCIFDEFPRMVGGDDAVVNWTDSRQAVVLRLLPGAQLLHVGSPWAPFGPAYTMANEDFGKPSRQLVVMWAPAYDFLPRFWTPERCAEAKAADPDAYETDVEARFAATEESLFSTAQLDGATRAAPAELPPQADHTYAAAMDPAHRSNAWAFVIGTREGRRKRIAFNKQWIGTRVDPLSSGAVLADIGEVCHAYGIKFVETDQYHVDSLSDLARSPTYTTKGGETLPKKPIHLVLASMTEQQKVEDWLTFRLRVEMGEVEFPPDAVFRADMQRLKKRVTARGVAIVLPKTSDGRHCDYAPPVLLVMRRWLHDVAEEAPEAGSAKALAREEKRMLDDAKRQWGRQSKGRWG